MTNLKETFDTLQDIYSEGVEKADEKGFAEKFKLASERIFSEINNTSHIIKFTFEDIEYLDGYFIFGKGTNSVVHFHIKETPGWKYGIWFDADEKTTNINYKWFAQYEENIDKFKPSASVISYDGVVCNEQPSGVWKVLNNIKFIAEHPELAFYRDSHFVDFNTEYVSEDTAKEFFDNWKYKKELRKELTENATYEISNYIKENILSKFIGAELYDCGENSFPRYDIIVPVQGNEEEFDGEGLYDVDDSAFKTGSLKEYNELVEKWKKEFSEKLGESFYNPFDFTLNVYDKNKRKEK